MKKYLLLATLCLAVFMGGCARDSEEPGVVARVNGRPITLAQLEFVSDMMQMQQLADFNPSLEQLRADHGLALADLIVQQLVAQELEKRGLEVTEEELRQAEEAVRADYPEGTFEEVLIEEYIDIEAWRGQLKARLSMEKFHNLVLRPRVRLDYQEAEKFYRDNIQDFYLPPRVSVVLITGPSQDLVRKATDAYRAGEEPEEIEARLNQVSVRLVKLREDRLPAAWKEALKGTDKEGLSPVWTDKNVVNRIMVLEEVPGRLLDPSQAYPLVETVLVERKLAEEFSSWLDQALTSASIKVSAHLLRTEEGEGEQDQATRNLEAERLLHDTPSPEEASGNGDPKEDAWADRNGRDDGIEGPTVQPELSAQDFAPPEVVAAEKRRGTSADDSP
ncbi:hypothetical protein dsat_1584 [Alkalidesulfovibrio alkalitolerans DSM 16529]|uniref:SurA domain-containing protein n=1 Tax=Alkalidesulfovibrio alkalitolerans DSM 16529 TaxID=1121439 RepID=S7U924_9BACT|nr:SurA N-terminal domain-containing protein [Alkalidesulfovibrio alkalitolerans]EPR30444.1 hypothetical protein dsat_1584 [Alkalidesulfovibrio alkalitolerans DSM 16529]